MDRSSVKVGCCGFPLTKPKYAEHFPVVEVQQTFYQPPRVVTLQRWRAEVPVGFEFVVKAWQLITHPASCPTYRRVTTELSETERRQCGSFQSSHLVHEAWLTTRACAKALAAEAVLFQCPASFVPSAPNLANLRQFFSGLDRQGLRLLWEPRGLWSDALVQSLCRELNLIHVVDPFLRATVTREFFYYRLHGGKNYQHRFEDRELRQLLAVLPREGPVYVMFNNVRMLEDGSRFEELLRAGLSEHKILQRNAA